MRRFIIAAGTLCVLASVVFFAHAATANRDFDPYTIEEINGYTIEYDYTADGELMAKATNASGESHIHVMPVRGFWGYVKNLGNPADANVAINLVWDGSDRSTEDAYSCPLCGYYYKYSDDYSAFSMLASLNTKGSHAPILHTGFRCEDELVRHDFDFNLQPWQFSYKICPPSHEETK